MIRKMYITECNGCGTEHCCELNNKKKAIEDVREAGWYSSNCGRMCLCPKCRAKFGRVEHREWTNAVMETV
jgi:hypothetical protein